MRTSTGVGFALLLVGVMLFGVATLPALAPSDSTDTNSTCMDGYEVTVIETPPNPEAGPIPKEYSALTLPEQEAFQLALLKDGTTRVETPVFETAARVHYQGTNYDVSSTPISTSDCPDAGMPFTPPVWVFGGSLLVFVSGLAVLGRSLWNHL